MYFYFCNLLRSYSNKLSQGFKTAYINPEKYLLLLKENQIKTIKSIYAILGQSTLVFLGEKIVPMWIIKYYFSKILKIKMKNKYLYSPYTSIQTFTSSALNKSIIICRPNIISPITRTSCDSGITTLLDFKASNWKRNCAPFALLISK